MKYWKAIDRKRNEDHNFTNLFYSLLGIYFLRMVSYLPSMLCLAVEIHLLLRDVRPIIRSIAIRWRTMIKGTALSQQLLVARTQTGRISENHIRPTGPQKFVPHSILTEMLPPSLVTRHTRTVSSWLAVINSFGTIRFQQRPATRPRNTRVADKKDQLSVSPSTNCRFQIWTKKSLLEDARDSLHGE